MVTEIRRGISNIRLIEQLDTPSPLSKALVLHSVTLELLQEIGLFQQFVDEGTEVHEVNLYSESELLVNAKLGIFNSKT